MRKFFHKLAIACLVALPIAGTGQAQTRAEGKAPQVRAFPNLTPIYRIAGVIDDGAPANTGIATTVSCTNFKASAAQVQFVVRREDGSVQDNPAFNILARRTFTASTHATFLVAENAILTPATVIRQGSMIIRATTPKVHCFAMIVDAGSAIPTFAVALSLTRLNQEKNAQE